MNRAWIVLLVFLLAPLAAVAEPDVVPEPPPELGDVDWLRDHDVAFAKAKAEDKPVFLFFQEVPG